MAVPSFTAFFQPTIDALKRLDGSGTIEEINKQIIGLLALPDEIVDAPHIRFKGTFKEFATGRTELDYRLAWCRTYLKRAGILENSSRGVWSLTEIGRTTDKIVPSEIVARAQSSTPSEVLVRLEDIEDGDEPETSDWKSELLTIIKKLPPETFERLAQRILREAGFVEVKVTGKSGDGGIDGTGIVRINPIVKLPALFQCKRYDGSVGPDAIREFRGAMTGRSDIGIFLTTGRFTRGAAEEATRDGAPPVELIDGESLTDLLKQLEIGVRTKVVEEIVLDQDFFQNI